MAPTTDATLVPFERLVEGIAQATDKLGHAAHMSWLGARVPTCPDWSMLDLLAHQSMVHRWAAAAIVGDEPTMASAANIEIEGRTHADPIEFLHAGSAHLRETLTSVPEDVQAFTFLKEAPAPRLFWARRQCHETTIHALDAVAAMEERLPCADDVWFGDDLALDGVDELLVGFWQRRRGGPRSAEVQRVLVAPEGSDIGWLVRTDPDSCVVTRFALKGEAMSYEVDAVVTGSARDLYLALWNRGGEVADPHGVLPGWAEHARITWH